MSARAARWVFVAALAMALVGCGDPRTFVPVDALGGPRGAIAGTVTYAGPAPCTRGGEVVGAAVILAFDVRALPPPDGLGTTAAGVAVVTGSTLFRGTPLAFAADGALACPKAGAPNVTASAAVAVAPLDGGVYQLRAFYDYDGNFNPAFSVFNLPTRGDVGGGAIDNAAAVLVGAPPQYRAIALGDVDDTGARVIPEGGALVPGVAVTLGLVLPLDRPRFFVEQVLDAHFGNKDPGHVVLPADYQLDTFSVGDPAATESSFVRLALGAGFPAAETAAAAGVPYFFPKAETITISRQDVNRDGKRDAADHIPETNVLPALAPLALMTRLTSGSDLVADTAPDVILQGVTLLDDLVQTALSKPDVTAVKTRVVVALRPAVVCIDPRNAAREAALVLPHPTDKKGNALLGDTKALTAALAKQLGRAVHVTVGCLPQGRYAVNLVYETSQAWTVPNEAGVCAASEPAGPGTCGARARLASQAAVLTVGPPGDASYCAAHPVPAECMP